MLHIAALLASCRLFVHKPFHLNLQYFRVATKVPTAKPPSAGRLGMFQNISAKRRVCWCFHRCIRGLQPRAEPTQLHLPPALGTEGIPGVADIFVEPSPHTCAPKGRASVRIWSASVIAWIRHKLNVLFFQVEGTGYTGPLLQPKNPLHLRNSVRCGLQTVSPTVSAGAPADDGPVRQNELVRPKVPPHDP